MKHLIWLTPGFATDEADSKCIPPLQLLAQQLSTQANFRLHIISLHYPFRQQPYQWHGVDVYPAYCSGTFAKIRTWWRAWNYLKTLVREYPQAQLHSFWLNDAALLGHWAGKRYGLTHRVTLMGQDARPTNRYLRLFPLPKLQLITLSFFHDEQLFQSTARRGDQIIPWGIATVSQLEQQKRTIDILGVGNLISLKDYSTFVRIIAQLKEQHPHIRAMLIGDGIERAALEQLAQDLGVDQHITFAGYLERANVLDYMQKSRVFLHPSTYESFGYVFLEALAAGMRVVSRPVGIASASEHWKVVQKENLLIVTQESLVAPLPQRGSIPYTIEDCLKNYLRIWSVGD